MKSILFLMALTMACSSNESKAPEIAKGVILTQPGDLQPLTKIGENQMGRFSPDGTKVIYQSRNRPSHKSAQIYTVNLISHREKRLTFNDGDDFSPSYSPNGKYILYSSTTDELKEHPEPSTSNPINIDPLSVLDPKANFEEIYQADADGSHIRRLTHSVGYDGDSLTAPSGRKIVYASQDKTEYEIFAMDPRGIRKTLIFKTSETIDSPSFSPNEKFIAFESVNGASKTIQIKIVDNLGKNLKQVTSTESVNRDPVWHPDSKRIIFSSNFEKPTSFQIYMINLDGTCLKKLTKNENQVDIYPAISADGKYLLFTSNRSGYYQIYLTEFQEPKECFKDKG